jgi:hypothetical protein
VILDPYGPKDPVREKVLEDNVNVNPKNFVGFCDYHRVKLTLKQMVHFNCLCKKNIGNRCPHFTKNEKSGYWQFKQQGLQKDQRALNRIKNNEERISKLTRRLKHFKKAKVGIDGINKTIAEIKQYESLIEQEKMKLK